MRRQTYSFIAMRPTLLRRLVAVLAAFALIVTLGLQGMQAVAMATMKSDMSLSMIAPPDAACAKCGGSHKGAIMQCQPVSVCAPSIAVLPVAEAILRLAPPALFEAENMAFDGRTGRPEPHPPKTAALL